MRIDTFQNMFSGAWRNIYSLKIEYGLEPEDWWDIRQTSRWANMTNFGNGYAAVLIESSVRKDAIVNIINVILSCHILIDSL